MYLFKNRTFTVLNLIGFFMRNVTAPNMPILMKKPIRFSTVNVLFLNRYIGRIGSFALISAKMNPTIRIVGFIFAEIKAKEPILPMYLFKNRTFTVLNLIGFFMSIGMFGAVTFLMKKPIRFSTVNVLFLNRYIGRIGSFALISAKMNPTIPASASAKRPRICQEPHA